MAFLTFLMYIGYKVLMSEFEDDFRFFKDAIESVPGEVDVVKAIEPQHLSRNDLQDRLNRKIAEAKVKKAKSSTPSNTH